MKSSSAAGGGIVSVPLLVFALHLSIAEASPIGLLAVMLAAGLGAALGLRAGIVRYKAAGLMAGCGLVLSPLGIWLAQRLPNAWLTVLFAAVLGFVALRMWRQASREPDALGWVDDRPPPPCQLDKMRGKLRWTAPCARSIMVAGSLAGFLSGLLGVGGGFVIVPALRGFTNLDIKSIVATSLAAITLVSAGGVIMASWQGLVNWEHAWPFAAGAAAGMLVGRLVAHRLAGSHVQQSFAVFALVVAVGLLIKQVL
jgi:uncharacterized membrane protein YfcA